MNGKGCFGSVFCNDLSSDCCKSCSASAECYELSLSASKKIDAAYFTNIIEKAAAKTGKVDYKKPKQCKEKTSLTERQKAIINNEKLDKNARILARSIFGKGLDGVQIVKLIENGTNPFSPNKPLILFLACDVLMRERRLRKSDLATEVVKTGAPKRSAVSASLYAMQALIIVGALVHDKEDIFVLRKIP